MKWPEHAVLNVAIMSQAAWYLSSIMCAPGNLQHENKWQGQLRYCMEASHCY